MKSAVILSIFFQISATFAGSGFNAIYRTNDLKVIDARTPAKIKELSKSVALIFSKDFLLGNYIQTRKLSDPQGINLCSDEKFANSNSVSACSGFLVAPDLVLTAGHCLEAYYNCQDKLIAFDVLNSLSSEYGYNVQDENIYECKEIVSTDAVDDVALIRLTRQVHDRPILKLQHNRVASVNEKVVMIGHPLGMPLTLSRVARVRDVSEPEYFRADLDSFSGNSGSPVFNQETLEVEGILVSGQEDLLHDSDNNCNRLKTYVYSSGVQSGEAVSRINNVLDFFKTELRSQVLIK